MICRHSWRMPALCVESNDSAKQRASKPRRPLEISTGTTAHRCLEIGVGDGDRTRDIRCHRPPLSLIPGCLSDCGAPCHPTGTPAAQTFLAFALSLRSSCPWLLYVHQSHDGSRLVSVYVSLLRCRHSLGPRIDAPAGWSALANSD